MTMLKLLVPGFLALALALPACSGSDSTSPATEDPSTNADELRQTGNLFVGHWTVEDLGGIGIDDVVFSRLSDGSLHYSEKLSDPPNGTEEGAVSVGTKYLTFTPTGKATYRLAFSKVDTNTVNIWDPAIPDTDATLHRAK